MSEVVTIRLTDEHAKMLDEMAEREGLRSKGQAAKQIVEEKLSAQAQADALEPFIDRIEERLARVASRGTKASIASLCLLSAWGDEAMSEKLDAMPAGKAFDYAWDMAGVLMSHGERPDFYKAAKRSFLMRARERVAEEEILSAVFLLDQARVIMALDDSDTSSWTDAARDYLAVRDVVERSPEDSSDEWLIAYRSYMGATKVLLGTLNRMGVLTVADMRELLEDEDMAFSYERGWFCLSCDADERMRRLVRRA